MPAGQLIAERDSDGTLIKYLCGPGGIPLQIRVTRTVGGTATTSKYFYQLDHAGSVVALTDEWGSAVARYAYDPWGRPVGGISGTDAWLQARQPLRYRGYCWDAETGMYYLPARYYDPGLARFISPDPAPADASDPLSLNAYAYCVDDPVNRTDRSGATDEDWWEDPVQLRNLQLGVYNTGPGGSVVLPRRWGRRVRRLHQAEFRQRHPQRATFRQRHPQAGPALIDPALSMGWRSPDPLCGSGVGSAGVEHTLRPESGDVGMFWVSQVFSPSTWGLALVGAGAWVVGAAWAATGPAVVISVGTGGAAAPPAVMTVGGAYVLGGVLVGIGLSLMAIDYFVYQPAVRDLTGVRRR